MKIVILGYPGAGKSTFAKEIEKRYGVEHFSVGQALREEIVNDSSLSRKVRKYMQKGILVPKELVMEVIEKDLVSKESFCLDGFPRSVEQLKEFEKLGVDLDIVLFLEVEVEIAKERIRKRAKEDELKGKMRDDDKGEIIEQRFDEYENKTLPLVEEYKKKGILKVIHAKLGFDDVRRQIFLALDEIKKKRNFVNIRNK